MVEAAQSRNFAKVDEWNSYGTNSSMDETATIIIGKLIDVAGNRYTHTTASVHAFRPVLPSGEKKVKGPVNRIWSSYREFRPIWPMAAFSPNQVECRFFSVCFLSKDFYE